MIARGGPAGAPHAPIGAAAVHARGARRGGADAGADDATRDAATRSIGVAVALGVVTMTFAALLLAYAIVRVQAPAWPPPGEPGLPRVWPWLLSATLAALGASAAMAWARRAVRAQAIATAATETATSPKLTRALGAAVAAGAVFVTIQARAWWWLADAGVRPSSGLVSSVVYALTVFHALHALCAVLLTLPALARALRPRAVPASTVAALASFWHFVTVAWVVILGAVFVA